LQNLGVGGGRGGSSILAAFALTYHGLASVGPSLLAWEEHG